MKRIKLTPLAKILIFLATAVTVFAVLFKTGAFTSIKSSNLVSKGITYDKAERIVEEEGAMNISLDEWVGWSPILAANGGLTTQSGSIYDELGLKLNISVIGDATQSSNALIADKLDGAGYTVNRFAFLYPKFKSSNVDVKMPYISNSSTGGDGIIARTDIKSIEDLVGKKIGVPRFSEAQTLVEWLLSKSSLSESQVNDIRNNMIMFDTPDDAAKAFFAGKLDAAATWQPFISQATSATNAHVLFSTKNATNIILDGVVFRDDYLKSNKDKVSKFIEGALLAEELYTTDFTAIRNSFPLFSTESDESIKEMTNDATLTNNTSNIALLKENGVASYLFRDMSNIWTKLGEEADPNALNNVFDASFVKDLAPKFVGEKINTVQFSDKQRESAIKTSNDNSLLTQRLAINFDTASANISSESFAQLIEFSNTATILDGTVIQIEGNTDNVGDPDMNMKLSEQRANSIAKFLQVQGVNPSRFVIVGNGDSKPIGDNNTPEGKAANRRTDVYFKVIQ